MVADPLIALVIPAYNAERYIETVIDRIPEQVWDSIERIWIVNDGSRDRTKKVLDVLADRSPKISPIHCTRNRGYGNAVKLGLYACRKGKCEIVCCLHADGQYPPESIPALVKIMQANRYDIVQGSRIASGTALSGGMPLYKYVAGKVLTFIENRIFGLHMTDYHSGYLFYSRKALESIDYYRLSNSFDFDLEVIASARSQGLRIAEQPIPTRYADEESHLMPITYGLRVMVVMVKYLSGVYRRRV